MNAFPSDQQVAILILLLLTISNNNFLHITIDDDKCVTFGCTPDDAIILPERIDDFVAEIQVIESNGCDIKESFISYLYCYSPLDKSTEQSGDGSVTLIDTP